MLIAGFVFNIFKVKQTRKGNSKGTGKKLKLKVDATTFIQFFPRVDRTSPWGSVLYWALSLGHDGYFVLFNVSGWQECKYGFGIRFLAKRGGKGFNQCFITDQ